MTQHVSHYHSDQIRELHAEIEQLKTNCNGWYQQNTELIEHRDKVQDENKLLRAEIERLRLKVPDRDNLLAEIAKWREDNDRLTAVLRYIIEIDDPSEAPILARRALEPKP